MDGIFLSGGNLKRLKQLARKQNSGDKVIEFLNVIESCQQSSSNKEKAAFDKLINMPAKVAVPEKKEFNKAKFRHDAEQLRKERLANPTESERIFDDSLTVLKIKHIREKLFFCENTFYFADFYFPKQKLVIEIDGKYHDGEDQVIKDKKRTSDLINLCGVKEVIRIKNEEFKDIESCKRLIKEKLNLRR